MPSRAAGRQTVYPIRLRQYRKRAGLTQAQLATCSDIHPKTLSRIENGGPPTLGSFAAMWFAVRALRQATALGVGGAPLRAKRRSLFRHSNARSRRIGPCRHQLEQGIEMQHGVERNGKGGDQSQVVQIPG